MKPRKSGEQWGLLSKVFHWLTALLVLVQIPLGFFAKEIKLSPLKLDLFVWHKSIGFFILLLAVSRLLWRIYEPAQRTVIGVPMQQVLAKVSHGMLYALILLLPISGWIISSAANIPINLFWLLEIPAVTGPDQVLRELAEQVHWVCVVLLIAVLGLHIGAALRHHFILHDTILKRMWF